MNTTASASHALAVILLGRGAVYAASEAELAQLAAHVHARLQAETQAQGMAPAWTQIVVQPAFVDRYQPALPEALDACQAAHTVVIVPVMVPDEPALRRWMHKLIMRWSARRGAHANTPRLIFAPPLPEAPQLAETLAGTVRQLLAAPDTADVPAVVGDDAWEHDPKGWSSVPAHSHHVLWCMGPRCAAKGAVQLWPELARVVRENPPLKKRLMLLQTSCQYPCNHGPLMIVYPEGAWYGPVQDAGEMQAVLSRHVLDGEVDSVLCVHGRPALPAKAESSCPAPSPLLPPIPRETSSGA
ncbi:(2Fe-2S) ferredoxin domain-containing protein [Comamonas composti]|uniref:(2Fe-2S) ferredoxin domain-containing protein n=1 Tax=Comamonas composti TaxID=408558 RepID=UPI0004091236|nr:(2Fe-2S) ferredoxin domain-containing protein [Comamonas composti]